MPKKQNNKSNCFRNKILWITFLVLDGQLHKTSQFEVLGNLAKKGYNATLIAIQSKNKFIARNLQVSIIPIPLRNIPLITSIVYSIAIFFFLPFYVAFSNPNYLIVQPTIPISGFISSLPIFKIKKIKVVTDIRTIPVQPGIRGVIHNFLFSSFILPAKKLFDGMTIITPSMKEELSRKYGLEPKKLGVWSSGVSPSLFDPKLWISDGLKLRKKFGLTNKFVVFYHGAFFENRGLPETIFAMKTVAKMHPEIVLFLLGSGNLTSSLKNIVIKEGLQDNVVIYGPVAYEEVPKFIAMADAAIIPLPDMHYWRFQSPLKMLEYLSMQKVVISSDIPAHRAVLGEATCGMYIPTVNSSEISKSIMLAFENRDKLQDWGEVGRQIINNGYSWQKVANDLETYLLSLT